MGKYYTYVLQFTRSLILFGSLKRRPKIQLKADFFFSSFRCKFPTVNVTPLKNSLILYLHIMIDDDLQKQGFFFCRVPK